MTDTQDTTIRLFASELAGNTDNAAIDNRVWKTVTASVRGPSHERAGQPCQDSSAWIIHNNRLIAVVSDGAGSAPMAREGSRHVAIGLVEALMQVSRSHDWFLTLAEIIDRIRNNVCSKHADEHGTQTIDDNRAGLTEDEKNAILRHYHATVVGVIADRTGGILFHIGDGAAAAWDSNNTDNIRVSRPENGRYANETYFFTVPDWKHHLRITRFGPCDRFLLTSDGATAFTFNKDFSSFEKRFIGPLDEFLTCTPQSKAGVALAHTLNDPKARKISQDDKTLLWAGLVEAGTSPERPQTEPEGQNAGADKDDTDNHGNSKDG